MSNPYVKAAAMILLAIVMWFILTPANAKDVLVLKTDAADMFLTDEACPPHVREFIKKDWKYQIHGGRVTVHDKNVVEFIGKETYLLCYSEIADKITVVDEFGEAAVFPRVIFHAPGETPPAKGQDKL